MNRVSEGQENIEIENYDSDLENIFSEQFLSPYLSSVYEDLKRRAKIQD